MHSAMRYPRYRVTEIPKTPCASSHAHSYLKNFFSLTAITFFLNWK